MVGPMMNLGKSTCTSTDLMKPPINRSLYFAKNKASRKQYLSTQWGYLLRNSAKNRGCFSVYAHVHIFTVLILSFLFLLSACSLQAPEDYYYEFALMEGWGKTNRQKTGRQLHEVIRHPENSEPLVIAFEVGKPPTALLGFVPYDVPHLPEEDLSVDIATPKVPISLRDEVLRRLFNEKQIRVVHWRLKNGRLKDDQNVVLLNFIPRALSERAIKEEYLIIFAIVHAAQTQTDTIDAIRCVAEDENGTPQMSLEAQVVNYVAYLEGKIDGQQWEQRLRFQRF